MTANIAVEVDDVSKRFRLYHEKYYSLKERVLHLGNNSYEDFWALKNIGFEVVKQLVLLQRERQVTSLQPSAQRFHHLQGICRIFR